MTFLSIARRVSGLAVLGAFIVPTVVLADATDRLNVDKESTHLINRVEQTARNVRDSAAQLKSYTNFGQVSVQTHYSDLNQIKDLVNNGLRPTLERLAEVQTHLPDWKQDAIDKLLDSAIGLAADTNAAILAKQDTGALPPVLDAEYKALISRIYDHSEVLVRTSDAAGDYAEAYFKAIDAGLEVPES